MARIWIESAPGVDDSAVVLKACLEERGLQVAPRDSVGTIAGVIVVSEKPSAASEIARAASENDETRVIAVSQESVASEVVRTWLEAGACDVIQGQTLTAAGLAIAARTERWSAIDQLLDSPVVSEQLVGTSPSFRTTLQRIVEVSAFTAAPVLLLGESGTGKEQIARLIHALDRRPNKRELVVLDCSTVMPELSGSEFFGHERGAFTGAITQREGAFAAAQGGTLFLDEVGELPVSLQAQLLRVVQELTFKRVGSNQWQKADFRLVSATNRDLSREIEVGGFRRDFYHRIAGWIFHLPPLRERRGDILPLVEHFAKQCLQIDSVQLDEPVRDFLLARSYPGNVRELRQVVARLCARHVGDGRLTVGDLAPEDLPALSGAENALDGAIEHAVARGAGLKEILRLARERAIRSALDINGRNVQQAARLLKVTDRALQMELAKRGD